MRASRGGRNYHAVVRLSSSGRLKADTPEVRPLIRARPRR
jgi:hypothetical protein